MAPFYIKKSSVFTITFVHFLSLISAKCEIDDLTHFLISQAQPDIQVVKRADELDYKSSDDWNTKTYENIKFSRVLPLTWPDICRCFALKIR